jgi:hypothetical protein
VLPAREARGFTQYTAGHVVEVTVAGDGSDLRRLFAERPNIFAACLEVSQEED